MLSRKAKYGLKAMLCLASRDAAMPMLVAQLACEESIPKKFLEQILLELKHRGLLQSKKGKGGGYLLARPAGQISMGEVIRALDGPIAPIPCVSETAYIKCAECRDERTCGIRMVMKEVRDAMCGILDSTTLAQVVESVGEAAAEMRAELRAVRSPGQAVAATAAATRSSAGRPVRLDFPPKRAR
jgi:Rrf2 family protein